MENENYHPAVRRNTLGLLLLIVLIAAFLRIYPLKHEALSGDELFSARVALAPFHESYTMVRDDLVHPPLYYLLLKIGVSIWGAGAVGLRLLSLAAGIFTIPLVWLLGRRLGASDATGLLAAALVALGVNNIYYSQEARSYATYTLLVLLFALWLSVIPKKPTSSMWTIGGTLMLLLFYIHYVAAIFLAFGLLALLFSDVAASVKKTAVALAVVVGVLFVPWLYVVAGVYRLKHGVGENLDWQGHPEFYELKRIWALSLGVSEIKGATAVALAVVILLAAAALICHSRRRMLRHNLLLLICVFTGLLAPLALFILSRKPINLPLFGLRHVLPATSLLCLVCCYGLTKLSEAAGQYRKAVFTAGALLLLTLAAVPEIDAFTHGPARFPYDAIEQQVAAEESKGIPAYTTWLYGIGEPINFYCHSSCVLDIYESADHLPQKFVLLYRPKNSREAKEYLDLQSHGFVTDESTYYTDGAKNPSGTTAATMERAPANQ
jgi:hypothetical protein